MEQIASRQNKRIRHLRQLARDRAYRRERREFVCDGLKLLDEAISAGVRPGMVLLREGGARPGFALPEGTPVFVADD